MDVRKHRAQIYRPLPWPEKAALIAAIVVALLALYASAMMYLTVGTVTYHRLNVMLLNWSAVAELAIVPPLWLVLRAIEFVKRIPILRRRREAQESRVEPRFERDTALMAGE